VLTYPLRNACPICAVDSGFVADPVHSCTPDQPQDPDQPQYPERLWRQETKEIPVT